MYSGYLTYIAVITSTVERPLYMAGNAIVWLVVLALWRVHRTNKTSGGIGSVLGPVIGCAFANSGATWIWARDPTEIGVTTEC